MVTQAANELTIEGLAHEAGMTVRNIRAHQSRGLLPPPEVRGRTGYYGAEHVARLRLIREMQADGFNLHAIERLLSRAEASGEEILDFKRTLLAPFESEEAEVITAQELARRLGPQDPKLVRKAAKLGIVRPLGDDRFEVPSPTLMRAGEELIALGVSRDMALEVAEQLKRHSEGVARAFTKVFTEGVWKPFREAGMPEDEWPRVREAIERLRPLAADALLAYFGPTMTRVVEEAFERQLKQVKARASGE
jgi:DNA-binding transcriptional MerR regulator